MQVLEIPYFFRMSSALKPCLDEQPIVYIFDFLIGGDRSNSATVVAFRRYMPVQFFLQQWLQETLIQSPTKAVKTKEGLSKVFGENKVFPSEKTEIVT